MTYGKASEKQSRGPKTKSRKEEAAGGADLALLLRARHGQAGRWQEASVGESILQK
jgi:hypothetical protein